MSSPLTPIICDLTSSGWRSGKAFRSLSLTSCCPVLPFAFAVLAVPIFHHHVYEATVGEHSRSLDQCHHHRLLRFSSKGPLRSLLLSGSSQLSLARCCTSQ